MYGQADTGAHDDQVLPIQQADREIKTTLQDVLDHLRRLTQQVNPRFIIGFPLIAHGEKEGCDLEAELRKAADALANWRKVAQGITEQEYYNLHSANEQARKQRKQANRRKDKPG